MKNKRLMMLLAGWAFVALPLFGQRTLSLPQCLELAVSHNRTLRSAALDVESADAARREAFTNYFPEVSASVLAFHTFDKLVKGDGVFPEEIAVFGEPYAAIVGQPFSLREMNKGYTATVSAVQPLFSGGRIVAGNKLAAIQQEAMRLQRSLTEKEVLQKVTECFWQIASVRYHLQTLDAADRQMETVLTETQNQVAAGVATRNALLRVQLRKQELASNRLTLENSEHILLMLLAQQIGLADETVTIELPEVVPMDPRQLYASAENAVELREEWQLVGRQVEAQRWQVRMERGKHLPTFAVGVTGMQSGFGGLSSNVKQLMKTEMTNGFVFGTLSIPISSWWGGRQAIRQQQIKLRQAELDRLEAREQLRIEIESTWSNLMEAYKQIELMKVSEEEASENLRMSQAQYKAGTESLSDLLDAETLHRSAQNNLSSALADYQIKLADYLRKTGR